MSSLLRVALTLSLVLFGAVSVSAQPSTPAADDGGLLTTLGLPELTLTAGADGLIDPPASVEAGRYVITLRNDSELVSELYLITYSEGQTLEDLEGLVAELNTGESVPDGLYTQPLHGGPTAAPGATGRAIVDLEPGDWVFDLTQYPADGEEGGNADTFSELTVTGEMPELTDVPTDYTVEMFEMGFTFVPGEISAGPAIWELTNTGDQPHFLELESYPEPFTLDQAEALLAAFAGQGAPATPGAEDVVPLDPEQLTPVVSSAVVSAGESFWIELDLEPGYYLAICWIPDQETGMPHAFMGMVAVVQVT